MILKINSICLLRQHILFSPAEDALGPLINRESRC